MDWFLYACLATTLLAGLALNLVGLPGLWLMVAGHALFAWLDRDHQLAGWPSALAMLSLALFAELLEFLAGAAGSKAAGGRMRSTIGAIVGGVAGGIIGAIAVPFVPVLNAILGACVGSFVGAALLEASYEPDDEDGRLFYRRLGRVGWGAFKGRLWGVILKSAVGLVMLVVSLVTAWS
jgi:uncharacterized protein YqgC (DUF456 family)